MNQNSPIQPLTSSDLHPIPLGAVILSGLLVAFLSQASSPDYRRLFWSVLSLAAFHLVSAGVYFVGVRHWMRWAVVGFAIIALGFLAEMTMRVWA